MHRKNAREKTRHVTTSSTPLGRKKSEKDLGRTRKIGKLGRKVAEIIRRCHDPVKNVDRFSKKYTVVLRRLRTSTCIITIFYAVPAPHPLEAIAFFRSHMQVNGSDVQERHAINAQHQHHAVPIYEGWGGSK